MLLESSQQQKNRHQADAELEVSYLKQRFKIEARTPKPTSCFHPFKAHGRLNCILLHGSLSGEVCTTLNIRQCIRSTSQVIIIWLQINTHKNDYLGETLRQIVMKLENQIDASLIFSFNLISKVWHSNSLRLRLK